MSRPWMRTIVLLLGVIFLLTVIGAITWGCLRMTVPLERQGEFPFNDGVFYSIFGIFFALFVPMLITLAMFVHRARKRARSLRGRVCLSCLYDLSTSPRDGKCPECGEKYTHDDLLEYWGVRDDE